MTRSSLRRHAALAAASLSTLAASCTPAGRTPTPSSPSPASHPAAVVGTATLITIPAGPFRMGCDPAQPLCEPDEAPLREVVLPAFAIDRTEVTQSAFQRCVASGRCTPPYEGPTPWEGSPCIGAYDPSAHPAAPVSCVTWEQAHAFCAWQGKRLPTEEEWEKAGRGTDARTYPWGETPPDCSTARLETCEAASTSPVASHPRSASPYGVLDLVGGVAEWTDTWYGDAGDYKVVRGLPANARAADTWDWRLANRNALAPRRLSRRIGLRCAADVR